MPNKLATWPVKMPTRGLNVPALAVGLAPEQVARIYRDIVSKRHATHYLHLKPLLVEQIPEIAL